LDAKEEGLEKKDFGFGDSKHNGKKEQRLEADEARRSGARED
jgi:hypothetical protein